MIPFERLRQSLRFRHSLALLALLICGVVYYYAGQSGPTFIMPPFEQGLLTVVVVDENEERIRDALVTPHGLRAVQRPGDHYGWIEKNHGPIQTFATNEDGLAEITYPKWVSRETAMLTSVVTVAVEHPDYCLQNGIDCQIPIAGTVTAVPRIRLKQGGRLRLKAYRVGRSEPLADFRALVSGGGSPVGWTTDGDARLSPSYAAGEHVLRVADSSDPDAIQFSDPVVFDVVPGKIQDLELRLRPGISLRGELDVPKPVKRGYVVVQITDLAAGLTSRYDQCVSWMTWTTVAENGEFEFRSLPHTSSIALDAWCEGYVCQIPTPATVPIQMTSVEAKRLPLFFSVKPDQPAPTFCRVAMEPCAICEVVVTGPNGRPVEGVNVGFAPNVSYHSNTSSWFGAAFRNEKFRQTSFATYGEFLRELQSTALTENATDPDQLSPSYGGLTDAEGKVLIANLPGRGTSSLEVWHDKYVVRGQAKPPFDADLSVNLQPGKTARIAVALKPKPVLTDKMLAPPPKPAPPSYLQQSLGHLKDLFTK